MANQENIRKWVDALRSGKYQQTTGKLSDGQAYCCLGVACEVAIESGLDLAKKPYGDPSKNEEKSVEYVGPDGDGSGGELPNAVATWLGFTYKDDDEDRRFPLSDPYLPSPEHPRFTAIEWNDDEKADFAKIADLIEQNYLGTVPRSDEEKSNV